MKFSIDMAVIPPPSISAPAEYQSKAVNEYKALPDAISEALAALDIAGMWDMGATVVFTIKPVASTSIKQGDAS